MPPRRRRQGSPAGLAARPLRRAARVSGLGMASDRPGGGKRQRRDLREEPEHEPPRRPRGPRPPATPPPPFLAAAAAVEQQQFQIPAQGVNVEDAHLPLGHAMIVQVLREILLVLTLAFGRGSLALPPQTGTPTTPGTFTFSSPSPGTPASSVWHGTSATGASSSWQSPAVYVQPQQSQAMYCSTCGAMLVRRGPLTGSPLWGLAGSWNRVRFLGGAESQDVGLWTSRSDR